MPPKAKKPLQISDIPFYQAVDLFEKGSIVESLPIFIECARQGNLYASHYVHYIFSTTTMIVFGLTPEQVNFIKPENFDPYFDALPNDFMPQSWLETSLIKQEFHEEKWSKKSKDQKLSTISKLAELADWCGNAYVYLLTLIRTNSEVVAALLPGKNTKKTKKIGLGALEDPRVVDLFMVIHDELYVQSSPIKNDFYLLVSLSVSKLIDENKQALSEERSVANEFSSFAKKGGDLERIIFKKLYDKSKKNLSDYSQLRKIKDAPKLRRLTKWHRAAANMGNTVVQKLISKTPPYVKDQTNRDKWLVVAAQHGEPSARLAVGIRYLVEKDWEKAFNMLALIPPDLNISQLKKKEISESLLCHAINAKGQLFERGPNPYRDERKALQHYQLAAELSFPDALHNIAVYYEQGRGGLVQDYKKALDYFLRCYELGGDPIVLEFIANLYIKGEFGLTQDLKQAEHYYRLCLNRVGCFALPASYSMLAEIIFLNGNPKDYDQAICYCKKALEMDPDDDDAKYALIKNYCLGKISKSHDINDTTIDTMVQAMFVKRPKIFERRSEILEELVSYYVKKRDLKKMAQFSKLGHEQSLDYCTFILGFCYEQGVKDAGIAQDDKAALLCYEKAAKTVPMAASNLGGLLINSRGIAKPDLLTAKAHLEFALDNGILLAACNLYSWYITHGASVLEITQAEAEKIGFKMLIKAKALEDNDIQFLIGYAYATGIGCEQDTSKALHFYEKAIQLRSREACVNKVGIILASCLKEDSISYDVLENCVELAQKGIAFSDTFFLAGQFTLGIMQMILDPNQTNNVMQAWKKFLEEPKDLANSKDDNISMEYMQNILKLVEAEGRQPSRLKIMLWLSKKVTSLKSLRDELGQYLRKEQINSSTMTTTYPLSRQEDQIDRLLNKIDEFTSQSPRKVDFGDFRRLINEVVSPNIGLVDLSIRHSKGSNIQMRFLVKGSEEPITFSHHKADFQDPGRGRSMQHAMALVAENLKASVQQTAEKNFKYPQREVKKAAENEQLLMAMKASTLDKEEQIKIFKPVTFSNKPVTSKKEEQPIPSESKRELTREEWDAVLSMGWESTDTGRVKTSQKMTHKEADTFKEKLRTAGIDVNVMSVVGNYQTGEYQIEIPEQAQAELPKLRREHTSVSTPQG